MIVLDIMLPGVNGYRICATLREAGVKPEALLGLLAHSCGWIDRVEAISASELLPRFSLKTIPPEPF